MRLLTRLFLPQRADAVALIVSLIAVLVSASIAVFGADRLLLLQLTMVFVATISFAIGAAAGCKQISFRRTLIMVAALIVAYATVAVLSERDPDSVPTPFDIDGFLFFSPSYLWLLPLIGLVSFALNWILGFVSARLATRVSTFKNDGQQRLRWMIGLAVLMFAVHQAIQFSQLTVVPVVEVATYVLLAVLSYWISDTLTGTWNWLKVSLCFLATAGVLIALVVNKPDWSGLFVITMPLVVGMLAAGSGVSRQVTTASAPPTATEPAGLPILRTSVWTLFLLLIGLCFLAAPWYLHVPTLFEAQSRLGFWDRFEVARRLTDFARTTESRISPFRGQSTIEFDFAKHSSPQALIKADRLFATGTSGITGQWTAFTLKNLHPDVQTNAQNIRINGLIIEQGTLRSEQLEDLSAMAPVLFIDNLSVQPTKQIKLTLTQLYLSNMSAEQLQSFFDALDPQSSRLRFYLQTPVTAEHWPIVAQASHRFPIECVIDVDEESLKNFPRVPTKNLHVHFMNQVKLRALLFAPAFCDTNIDFRFFESSKVAPLSSILEARLLLRGNREMWGSWNSVGAYQSISDWKSNQLLVYERDENENPLGLLCPLPFDPDELPTTGLDNLKTLTFNLNWIDLRQNQNTAFGFAVKRNFSAKTFARMPRLERLVFPAEYQFENLAFISELPKLKQLEIALASIPDEEYAQLVSLQALERLTLLDEPTDELFEVLAKLKRLKQLTLVLPNSYGQTKTLQKSVKKFLPDIQLTMVEEDEYQPDIPDSFKQHFSRVIQELKAKLAASEEIDQDGD